MQTILDILRKAVVGKCGTTYARATDTVCGNQGF
ncbi:hypothetical protein HDF09_002783 [Edaphobacter lichenicola]|uniref:Uncharacterized protein n=1 Tax=Tunturiibacter empetritectus TaxID=3069691 RepID=A0A7W8IJ88_9BACT|nr:hypothetical protein [Edaphobacter lichenicola]